MKKQSTKEISDEELSQNDLSDVSELDKLFSSETSNSQDHVKELFAEDKVKARTDLSASQIVKISKAYYLFKLANMPEGKALLDTFLTLRISKDRKSRAEFVDGLKAKLDNAVNQLNTLKTGFGK